MMDDSLNDSFTVVDKVKFEEGVQTAPRSPKLKSSFLEENDVAMSVTVTNSFLMELQEAKVKCFDVSYVTIFNSQLDNFQLKQSDRLEKRFSSLISKCMTVRKQKSKKGGRQLKQWLQSNNNISILSDELENVRSLTCCLSHFQNENMNAMQRCDDVLKQLEDQIIKNSELDLENSSLIVSESGLKSDKHRLLSENSQLKNDMQSLQNTNKSYVQANEIAQHAIESLTNENNDLKEQNTVLSEEIKLFKKDQSLKSRATLDEVKNKSRKIKSFSTEAQQALWFADSFGLIPSVLKCQTKETGASVHVDLSSNSSRYNDLNEQDKKKLKELCFILDKFSISDSAYRELSHFSEDLPRKSNIDKLRSEMVQDISIERVPGNVHGAYVSVADEIKRYIKVKSLNPDDTIKIKIAGDGSKVSRVSNFIVFSLTFLDSSDTLSTSQLKTLAIVKCKEDYDNLKVAGHPLFQEINSLLESKKIVYEEGKEYSLEIYLGGDMKFIQILLGLGSAASLYPCPWCHVSKNEIADMSKTFDFYSSDTLARTAVTLKQHTEKHAFGSKHPPLINIDPSFVVPDELHLLLRICDRLLRNLIDDAKNVDTMAQILGKPSDAMKTLVERIRDCGVNFYVWKSKSDSVDIEWSSLNGSEYKKLLEQLPDKLCFVIDHKTHDQVTNLWRSFNQLYKYISKEAETSIPSETVFEKCHDWISSFLQVGRSGRIGYDKVTPYMHCLVYHVPRFIANVGRLEKFSGQAVEKINDEIKFMHQKRTNKFDTTVDELRTRKRMEILIEEKCERSPRPYLKRNHDYWENQVSACREQKRQRILSEMQLANDKYLSHIQASKKALEDMSIAELKDELKALGVKTRKRKKEELIKLVRENMNQNA